MLVKLSGNRYVNTEQIESITPIILGDGYSENKHPFTHTVRMQSGDCFKVHQEQYSELLIVLRPIDAIRKRAEQTLIGQLGANRWFAMSEDAQYDAVSAEVERG